MNKQVYILFKQKQKRQRESAGDIEAIMRRNLPRNELTVDRFYLLENIY